VLAQSPPPPLHTAPTGAGLLPGAQDLPEYFEDHLSDWMTHFTALLKYSNASLAADDDDTEPSPVSCLQAEVVDCLALLMSKVERHAPPVWPKGVPRIHLPSYTSFLPKATHAH
jgi:hypothetical protein